MHQSNFSKHVYIKLPADFFQSLLSFRPRRHIVAWAEALSLRESQSFCQIR